MATHLPGRAADSPANTYIAPGRFREAPPGLIAAGHPVSGSPVPGDNVTTAHLNFQSMAGPSVVEMTTGGTGALGSSINEHTGMARVGLTDQASAASPGFLGQLGANRPSGDPSVSARDPGHTAPSGVGQEFRVSPQRPAGAPARHYQHVPGELQGPPVGSGGAA